MKRHIRHIWIVIMAVLMAVRVVAPAQAEETIEDSALYRELDRQTEKGGFGSFLEVLQTGDKLADYKKRLIILQWLQNQTVRKKSLEPFYYMAYSDLLYTTGEIALREGRPDKAKNLQDSSFLLLRMFEVLARADAERCTDTTAEDSLDFVLKRYGYFTQIRKNFTEEEWRIFKLSPLALEEKLAKRPGNAAICHSGVGAIQYSQTGAKRHEIKDPHDPYGTKVPINTEEGDDDSTSPAVSPFITDGQWQQRREALRKKLEDRWNIEAGQ